MYIDTELVADDCPYYRADLLRTLCDGTLLIKVGNDQGSALGILKSVRSADGHQGNDAKIENGDENQDDDERREDGQGEPDGTVGALEEADILRVLGAVEEWLNLEAVKKNSTRLII